MKHGMYGTREYQAWRDMLNRCRRARTKEYPWYGGRGISVCDRWLRFENFLADVGHKPSPEHELDRIDNDGHYEPGNVRWTTRAVQINNRRNTRFVVYRGDRLPLTEAVRRGGDVIHYESAAIRIFRCGWPVDLAVETPPDPNHPRTRPR